MNGILLIDKPSGITSYDVIRKLKKKIKGVKIGHAGTLDPLASGLLIILLGSATKLFNLLTSDQKKYSGTIIFGDLYDTYDIKGRVIDSKVPNIKEEDVERGFNHFNNLTYMQMPPIYSALKIDGKKAYEYARSGEEVKLEPREVTIHSLVKTSDYKNSEVSFETVVSKQTYIRSLAYDLGAYLGEFAALKTLRREEIGPFSIKDATTIEDFKLISINEYFKDFKQFKFDEFTTQLVKNGVWLDSRQTEIKEEFVILDEMNNVIALYEPTGDGRYRPKIMF
ncbi:MAG: tRNA pseudouridine(55) synthase TruB [Acholeplasmataceae bacterium]|jgi:tRNA pseudouridine55 synthase